MHQCSELPPPDSVASPRPVWLALVRLDCLLVVPPSDIVTSFWFGFSLDLYSFKFWVTFGYKRNRVLDRMDRASIADFKV